MSNDKKMYYYYQMIEWSLMIPALMFGGMFIYIAHASMPYPYLLEWMEGQSIDVILRVLHGQSLYTAPSLDYVPLIYPPFYYYVAAFFTMILGGDFYPARLTSFLATLGVAGVIYAWLRKEDASWRLALTGACIYLATYRLSGRWFDMSRVDSLFMFLTLFGLYIAVFSRGLSNVFAAAALLTAAFFTKQSALMVVAPVLLAMLCIDWRHAMKVGCMLLAMIGAALLILHFTTGGWYEFYIFTVPAGHELDPRMYKEFWKKDVFGHVDVFFIMSVCMLGVLLATERAKGVLYTAMFLSFVGTSYISRMHSYGYINVLMPLHAVLAIIVGISLARCRALSMSSTAFPVAGVMVLMGLASIMYNPNRFIPTPEMQKAGDNLIEELRKMPGDVFIPELQYIQTRAGKKSYAFGMAAYDVMRAKLDSRTEVKKQLREELLAAIQGKRFDVVMPGWIIRIPGVPENYIMVREITPSLRYVTGALGATNLDVYLPNTVVNRAADGQTP